MAWYRVVDMSNSWDYVGVDHMVVTPIDNLYEYDEIHNASDEELDVILRTINVAWVNRYKELLQKTRELHFANGVQIHIAQSKYHFGGFLEMDGPTLEGYLSMMGSWNNFDSTKVNMAINSLDGRAPRMDYGVNNPNTGRIKHKWSTTGEYVTMKFDYVGEREAEKIISFFHSEWETKGREIKADSIRYELNDLGHGHFSVELIMWWD